LKTFVGAPPDIGSLGLDFVGGRENMYTADIAFGIVLKLDEGNEEILRREPRTSAGHQAYI
jgi:hypothetical protein